MLFTHAVAWYTLKLMLHCHWLVFACMHKEQSLIIKPLRQTSGSMFKETQINY